MVVLVIWFTFRFGFGVDLLFGCLLFLIMNVYFGFCNDLISFGVGDLVCECVCLLLWFIMCRLLLGVWIVDCALFAFWLIDSMHLFVIMIVTMRCYLSYYFGKWLALCWVVRACVV